MNLQNGEYFGIVRQLPDPNDAATYYVRAEIRDAGTDELFERVTLTDRGSRRFSVPWLVNARRDGAFISIMTAVYTDAGFTTPSDNYAQEIQTYLVETRNLGGGGGSGGIGEKRLREILKEELKPLLDRKPTDHKALHEKLFEEIAKKIEIEGKATREKVLTKVGEIDVKPEVKIDIKETDLSSIIEAIETASSAHTDSASAIKSVKAELNESFNKFASAMSEMLASSTSGHSKEVSTVAQKAFEDVRGLLRALLSTKPENVIDGYKPDEGSTPAEPVKSPAEIIRDLRQQGAKK